MLLCGLKSLHPTGVMLIFSFLNNRTKKEQAPEDKNSFPLTCVSC